MDALIRSVRLAPSRTRLSDAHQADEVAPNPEEIVRADIEARLRTEAAAQAQKLYEAERKRAHAEGRAAGIEEARAHVDKVLTEQRETFQRQFDEALSALRRAHELALVQLDSAVGELAFAAVCRFVGSNAAKTWFVSSVVEQVCTVLRGDAVATARLHPRDIQILNELQADGEMRIASVGLKLIPDGSLQLGGCVLEAASGHYDGGLENQLQRLHAVFAGARAAAGSKE